MYDRDSISDDGADDGVSRDYPQSQFGRSTHRSRYTQNKTGGEFVIDGLEEKHKNRDGYYQRDEFNTFEFEMA